MLHEALAHHQHPKVKGYSIVTPETGIKSEKHSAEEDVLGGAPASTQLNDVFLAPSKILN